MSGSTPQKGIPQTGIGPASTGTQAFVAKQGLIASAPWANPDGSLAPSSFRLLLNILTQVNSIQQRLKNAGIP